MLSKKGVAPRVVAKMKVKNVKAGKNKVKRHYIRHPADIPIELIPETNPLALSQSIDDVLKIEKMENVSFGGLMFQSSIPYTQSKNMIVKINSIKPQFEARATVCWCRKSGRFYMIGLEFADQGDEFKLRMVEQVCHIMHYRNQVLTNEGRELANDEAAKEWIEHYAANFPK